MQVKIPPEFRVPEKRVGPTTGIDKAPEMEHHDPSNVIFFEGNYYVWFTEHHMDADGFRGCVIKYATSPNGLHWYVRGIALDKGKPDGSDAQGVLTCCVVPADGKWTMFFLAVGADFRDSQTSPRGIWLAEADTPDGPWRKHLDAPVLWPDGGTWDELCCDDPNVIFRDGTWWLYYKGRKMGSQWHKSDVGLAQSDEITGPYIEHLENPLMTGHAHSEWVHRNGVAAVGGESESPEAQCVRWSRDGVHFVEAGVFPNKSTGI
jgi:hypothetical protein